MFTAEEIINYYQKPLICESKYDGIRAQMHKCEQIRLFSRNLSDITNAFPELANAAVNVKLLSSTSLSDIDFILDGEVMAFQNGKPLHFQELQKRIHKKNLTEQIITETPLVYVVFDIMYFNGESLIKKSIKERKEILSSISFKEPIINSIYKFVNSEEEILHCLKKAEILVMKEWY